MMDDPFASIAIAIPHPKPTPEPPTSPAPNPTPTPEPPAVATSAANFVKWAAAIAALWFVLVALHEYGGGAQDFGTGLALLILVSVLLTLGPKAADNVKGFLA